MVSKPSVKMECVGDTASHYLDRKERVTVGLALVP